MLYKGEFVSRNNKSYVVNIQTDNITTEESITMADSPVVIESSSERLFSPIKSRGITINILSKDHPYFDFYSSSSRGVKLSVIDNTTPANPITVFRGYMTPCRYDQDWSYVDTLSLEGVDALSTTKDYKWNGSKVNYSFFDIIIGILKSAGYQGDLFVPRSYVGMNINQYDYATPVDEVLKELYVSGANFYDNDAEQTPWSEYDVLEEIMKYLGWSMIPDGDNVWCVDYRYIINGGVDYYKYDIQDQPQPVLEYTASEAEVEVSEYRAPGSSTVSIDDIYSKIEISDNLYKIDSLFPDIFNTENLISVTDEADLGVDGSLWTNTSSKEFLWWEWDKKKEIVGYDYQTFFRIKPSNEMTPSASRAGYTHLYYNPATGLSVDNTDGRGYHLDGSTSKYTTGPINRTINTVGALIQRFAHRKNNGPNNLPVSLDWNDYLTFFICNDTTPNWNIENYQANEKPVLIYRSSESFNLKPTSGKSWITITGDLYYQYNGYKDSDKKTVNIINTDSKYYQTAPIDNTVSMEEKKLGNCYREYSSSSSSEYGKGFKLWKMSLKIGNKYWNGSGWQNTWTTFYINYNNDPGYKDDEYVSCFAWMKPVNTSNYKDKVGVDGYCIPIDSADPLAPTGGNIELSIYTPLLFPPELIEIYKLKFRSSYMEVNWKGVSPVVYCKNFKVGYVYTDSDIWYNDDNADNSDKVYTGYINTSNIKEFDNLEFKINTALPDKPISRSYVLCDDGFVSNMKHEYGSFVVEEGERGKYKEQEYNVIDQYLDHYSEKKIIYSSNIHGHHLPISVFHYCVENVDGDEILDTRFVLDSESYDLDMDNNKIKLIQY